MKTITNSIINTVVNLTAYIVFAIIFTGLLDWCYEIATSGGKIPMTGNIIIGLIVLILSSLTFISRVVEVDGNEVLLTINLLIPKFNNGASRLNGYPTGIHILLLWEKVKGIQSLEADIAETVKTKASTLDDDIMVEIQYDVEPDPNNLSEYVLNGKDEKEREENLKKRFSPLIKRQVEKFTTGEKSEDIVNGSKSEELQKRIKKVVEDEAREMGCRARKVRIGNVDYSKAVSDARNDRKTIEERGKAIKHLMDTLGMTKEEAKEYVQAETGKAKQINWNIKTAPTLKQFAVYGGLGETSSDKPKKNKNSKGT